jgi:hypothetical protein
MGWFFCLSDRMIQIENLWMDLDEIWSGVHATGDCPEIILLNYLQSVTLTWRTNKLVRWDRDQPTEVTAKTIEGHCWKHCRAKIVWVEISPRMAKDATMTLHKISATMNWDHITAKTTYVMWREEHLWNFGVLQRVRLSSLI